MQAIPDETHPCWQKLATHQVPNFAPKQLGLQFLFTRLSHENMSTLQKAREIHAFFVRYQRILTWEINELQRLRLV